MNEVLDFYRQNSYVIVAGVLIIGFILKSVYEEFEKESSVKNKKTETSDYEHDLYMQRNEKKCCHQEDLTLDDLI